VGSRTTVTTTYTRNPFVSEYATTNPVEDIAESFTQFVIQDKPKGDSVKDQKMLFFYKFEEMIRRETQNAKQGKKAKISDWHYVRREIGNIAERYLVKKLKRRPLVLPVVIEV